MKKLIVIGLAFIANFSFAQKHNHESPANPIFCGQVEQEEAIFNLNPEFKMQDSIGQAQFQIDYENYLANEYSPDERVSYTIPIVFHVVHLDGPENISNAQFWIVSITLIKTIVLVILILEIQFRLFKVSRQMQILNLF